MSPIEIGAPEVNDTPEDLDAQAQEFLETEDGELTIEGEIIRDFLEDVDMDALFDVEEAQEHIEVEDGFVVFTDEGYYADAEPDDENGEDAVIETMPGDVVAQVIDMDDLYAMFEYHVVNELPEDSLEEKARKAVALQLIGVDEKFGKKKGKKGKGYDDDDEDMDEDALEEKFKRGTFVKMSGQGGAPRAMVNRMLGAMMNKEAIKRASAPGKGYKAPGAAKKGDYRKFPGGYGVGTPKGIKKWLKYKKTKAAQLAKAAKKTKKAKKVLAAKGGVTAGGKKKKTKKKAQAKKGAKVLAKKKGGAKKKKKKLTASDHTTPAANVSEGAALAGKMMSGSSLLSSKPLHETDQADD
jgi:hypothetical protein